MAFTIDLHLVKSSNLHAVGYDAARRILAVQFKDGHIWHYAGVAADVWADLCAAPSLGSFYTKQIRGKFQAQKMTGACPKCGDTGHIGVRCEECGCDDYQGAVQHALVWDHPAAASKRQQPTVCGLYVKPSEIARSDDEITCAECRATVEERAAIEAEA
jgi:YD repeat-containing protein